MRERFGGSEERLEIRARISYKAAKWLEDEAEEFIRPRSIQAGIALEFLVLILRSLTLEERHYLERALYQPEELVGHLRGFIQRGLSAPLPPKGEALPAGRLDTRPMKRAWKEPEKRGQKR